MCWITLVFVVIFVPRIMVEASQFLLLLQRTNWAVENIRSTAFNLILAVIGRRKLNLFQLWCPLNWM